MKIKQKSLLLTTLLAVLLLFNSCDSIMEIVDMVEDDDSSSSSSASLSLSTPILSSNLISADQKSTEITLKITITGSNGGSADLVTLTGDSISDTYLSDDDSDDTWEGSFTPDTSDYLEGDTLDFTITAEDSSNGASQSSSFTLSVTAEEELVVGAYVSQFITSEDNLYAQEEKAWFEITLTDVESLGDEWYVKYTTDRYIYTALSSTNIDADLSDDDIIRIHSYGTGEDFDDTDQDEDSFGNESVWDFEAEDVDVNTGDACGMFFIQVGSGDPSEDNVINLIPFNDTELNSDDDWFSDDYDAVATLYAVLVEEELWTAEETDSSAYAVQFDGENNICSASDIATEADDVTVGDPTIVTLSTSGYSLTEGSTDSIELTFTRSANTEEDLDINVTLTTDATEWSDYIITGLSDGIVTIDEGNTTATVTIYALSDDEDDEEEEMAFSIDEGEDYFLGTDTSVSGIAISDDE
ncbi:MAG: hypothetical protein PQJ60_01460 [Spirochaetales bacterium]|nr:hypothetical protein [Spirochaetales bacterium]